jgi:hypothetical protein
MGWGKGKGFGLGPFVHHHHHRGPGVGLIAAEAAVVGAVAGATIAAYPQDTPYRKGKGKGKGPTVVIDNTPPLRISSINMQLQFAEIRGITYLYAVDVMPEAGNPWRVMRSYKDFEELFLNLGRPKFSTATFPKSLDKMASGDRRYSFGMAIGTCFHCKATCRNRGDKDSQTVYCSTCYPLRFPDPAVLQTQHHQLQSWLQCVIQHPSSDSTWKISLRGFLEAGREFISPTVVQRDAYTPPIPTSSEAPETPVEQHHDKMICIEIPSGVIAGQVIAITVANGNQIQWTVPEGHKGGDTLTLWHDSATGTLTHVEDSQEQPESDQALSIEVPAGVKSGELIAIMVPDGREIQLTVPEGKKSGDRLDLWFDFAVGALTPLL